MCGVWACCCGLLCGVVRRRYTMVTGVPPFVGDNLKKLSECILLREPNYDHKCIQYDYALKDLLKRML